jgi:hypothetical protein
VHLPPYQLVRFENLPAFSWLVLLLLTACGETTSSSGVAPGTTSGALEAPVFAQQAKLVATDPDSATGLGAVVAIDGDTALVQGSSTYIYVRSGATWAPQQKLPAGGPAVVSGNTIAMVKHSTQGPSLDIHVRVGSIWGLQQSLKPSDWQSTRSCAWKLSGAMSNSGLAISGDVVVVGCFVYQTGSGLIGDESVYVFQRTGSTWALQQELVATDDGVPNKPYTHSDLIDGDRFGEDVAISGDTILVGAHRDSLQAVNDHRGSAYVFTRTGSTWNEVQKLSAGTARFGSGVRLSGNAALVGEGESSAHVFVRTGSSFIYQQQLIPSNPGQTIDSLAFSGDVALLGDRSIQVGNSQQQGVAYVFVRDGSSWTLTQTITAGDGQAGQAFGYSSALSGNTAVVGAPFSDAERGAAYIFSVSPAVPLPSSAPTLLGPSGGVATQFPTYRFTPVAGATHYRLDVSGFLEQVLSASELGCQNLTGTCAVTPVFPLRPQVAASWRVQAQNSAGVGPWSSAFSISTSLALPTVAAPTSLAPTGSVQSATPTYTWNAVAGTTRYAVWVVDALATRLNAPHTVLATFDPAQAGCSGGGVCSVTPAIGLVPGSAKWWVRADSSQWITRWSETSSFTVPSGMPAGAKPVLLAPLNTEITGYPTYSWRPIPNAIAYDLWVNDSVGVRHRALYTAQEAGCTTGTVCAVTPLVDVGAGAHTWWVAARNGQVTTPWSSAGKFDIKDTSPPHAAPVLVSPLSGQINGTLTYSWRSISNATEYYLWINDAAGTRHRVVYTAQAAGCISGNTCAITPNLNLGTGYYSWWVRAQNPYGNSAWSSAGKFDVGIIQPPGEVTILAPIGGVRSHRPLFTWNAVSGAAEYLFQVTDAAGTREARIPDCQAFTCFATPFSGLAEGPVTWRMRAENIAGPGPWSGSSFVVDYGF